MANVYYNLINNNLRVIGQVPSVWCDQVIALYAADVVRGRITEEKFEAITGVKYADYVANER